MGTFRQRAFPSILPTLLAAGLLLLLCPLPSHGQETYGKGRKSRAYEKSSATGYYNAEIFEKEKVDTKKVIYVRNGDKYLVGNKCVEEFTLGDMGFRYELAFQGPGENLNLLQLGTHNTWVKFRMLWKHGFGWGRKVRSRIRECRQSSGDFSG